MPRSGKNTPAWSPDDEERLKKLVKDGRYTFSHIASMMNKGRNACIGKAHRMGLKVTMERNGKLPPGAAKARKERERKPSPKPLGWVTHPTDNKRVRREQIPLPDAVGPLNDLPERQFCQFIAGDVRQKPWQACGHPVAKTGSGRWCDAHSRVIYEDLKGKPIGVRMENALAAALSAASK